MKKVFCLLLVALVMAGCGGAGTSTTSGTSGDGSGGGGGVVPISGPVGIIRVVFGESGPAPSAPLKNDNVTLKPDGLATILADEHGFRVSVSKYVTDNVQIGWTKTYEEGDIPTPIYKVTTRRTFFRAIDNTAPGEITIQVPVDNGYLIEVVSYDKAPNDPAAPPFQMKRYGYVDNVTVNEGFNQIELGPSATSNGRPFTPIAENTILFSRSETITSGFDYTMNVTYNSKVPLRDKFNFADNLSNIFLFNEANIDNTLKTIGVTFTSKAPVPPSGAPDNNIYFQGQFYISDSMLSDKEISNNSWKNFRLNAPASYNDDIYQHLYMPADLYITI